jgi:GNAT superfamily N-acetyltransferase
MATLAPIAPPRHAVTPRAKGPAPGRELRVRHAKTHEVELIAEMVRGLAAHCGLSAHCRIDVDRLRRHGFGRQRRYRALLAFGHGRPLGLALYYFTYSTFLAAPTLWLEDLFVRPEARNRGLVTLALLRALARVAQRRGCARIGGHVPRSNTRAVRFLEGVGFRFEDDLAVTRLDGAALEALARRGAGRSTRKG